jgi:hypothetical protein
MSSDFEIDYRLTGAGWADGCIIHGAVVVSMTVSYLRDTLCELAEAAISLLEGADEVRIVFMDEPGEHQMILTQEPGGAECEYTIRWFEDWESWGMHELPGSREVASGRVPVHTFARQMHDVLVSLYQEHGEQGYQSRWIEHPFPQRRCGDWGSC